MSGFCDDYTPKIRSEYTVYCIQQDSHDTIYGVLFIFLFFSGNATVFENDCS